MSNLKRNNIDQGVEDLVRMDSVYLKLGSIYPPVRNGYRALINHYENIDRPDKQLHYVKQLIKHDSIFHKDYAFISKGLVDEVEKAYLLNERMQLESQLKGSKNITYIWMFLIAMLLTIIFAGVKKYKKQLLYKKLENEELHSRYQKKFDAILDLNNRNFEDKAIPKIANFKKEDIGIDKDVVSGILSSLQDFEEKKLFVDSNITAATLAKSMGTNANYLGRVIKYEFGKSFRNYINDVRVRFALEQLRSNSPFRSFSVLAMAKEVGFKELRTFRKGF